MDSCARRVLLVLGLCALSLSGCTSSPRPSVPAATARATVVAAPSQVPTASAFAADATSTASSPPLTVMPVPQTTCGCAGATRIFWSPDGQYLLLDDNEAHSPIWRLRADGTGDLEKVVDDGFLIETVAAWQ